MSVKINENGSKTEKLWLKLDGGLEVDRDASERRRRGELRAPTMAVARKLGFAKTAAAASAWDLQGGLGFLL